MKKIILAVLLLLAVTVQGTTKYWGYSLYGEMVDSVIIQLQNVTDASYDTTIVKTFPAVDSFAIDDAKAYKVTYLWRYTGDTLFYPVSEPIAPSAATSGIDSITNAIADANKGNFKYSGGGTGTYTHYTLVKDSGATPDSVLYNMNVFCYNAAGSFLGKQQSLADGFNTWFRDSGAYTFKIVDAQYVMVDSVVDTVTQNSDTTIIYLYDNAGVNKCNVCGYVTNLNGDSLSRCLVEFWLVESSNNSSDSATILPGDPIRTSTDAHGYFSQSLYYSSVVGDKDYKMKISKEGYASVETTITVPDSVSYKVRFNL